MFVSIISGQNLANIALKYTHMYIHTVFVRFVLRITSNVVVVSGMPLNRRECLSVVSFVIVIRVIILFRKRIKH